MFCKNCGNEYRTTEREGVIHTSGKYACYPNVKPSDPRWALVATESDILIEVDWAEEDAWMAAHEGHGHSVFTYGIVCLI